MTTETATDRPAYLLSRLRACGAAPKLDRVGRLWLANPDAASDTLRAAALGWRVQIEALLRAEEGR